MRRGAEANCIRAYLRVYFDGVTADARRALQIIRDCVEADHFALSFHFAERMIQRGLFWPDIMAVLDDAEDVRSQGLDRFDRPKWIVTGQAADGGQIEIVCAIESNEDGTEFITIYWED